MSEQSNPSAQAKAAHETWLHQMEAESRAKQVRFMDDIATRLKRPRQTEPPVQPFRGAPAFWHEFEWSAEQRIEEFTANFTSVGGHVVRLSDLSRPQTGSRTKRESWERPISSGRMSRTWMRSSWNWRCRKSVYRCGTPIQSRIEGPRRRGGYRHRHRRRSGCLHRFGSGAILAGERPCGQPFANCTDHSSASRALANTAGRNSKPF